MRYKITPIVRQQIDRIVTELPVVPVFIKTPTGFAVQRNQRGERIDSVVDGNSISYKRQLSYHPRMMNHKVNLIQYYQTNGIVGIEMYINHVHDLNNLLNPVASDEIKS